MGFSFFAIVMPLIDGNRRSRHPPARPQHPRSPAPLASSASSSPTLQRRRIGLAPLQLARGANPAPRNGILAFRPGLQTDHGEDVGMTGVAIVAVALMVVVFIDTFETMILPRRVRHAYRLARLYYLCAW